MYEQTNDLYRQADKQTCDPNLCYGYSPNSVQDYNTSPPVDVDAIASDVGAYSDQLLGVISNAAPESSALPNVAGGITVFTGLYSLIQEDLNAAQTPQISDDLSAMTSGLLYTGNTTAFLMVGFGAVTAVEAAPVVLVLCTWGLAKFNADRWTDWYINRMRTKDWYKPLPRNPYASDPVLKTPKNPNLPLDGPMWSWLGPEILYPDDPNAKLGPAGSGDAHWIPRGEPLRYTILFENKPEASAPAQEVIVRDLLSGDLDWSTFRLTDIQWGSYAVELPPDANLLDTRETIPDYRSDLIKDWWVDVKAEINPVSGEVKWAFRTLDPETSELPEDARAGFLPPNDDTHRGEGRVSFTVFPKAGVAEGTRITNSASIVFDQNPAIATNEVFNTIGQPQEGEGEGEGEGEPPQLVAVPNVIGLTQAAAQTVITGAGLALGTVTEQHHASVPAGQVISQVPDAETEVAIGSTVALLVSTGPEPAEGEGEVEGEGEPPQLVAVPNVVGLTQAAAQTAINGAGLALGPVNEQHHASVPAGQVISQVPDAETEVAIGSTVALFVSTGPEPAEGEGEGEGEGEPPQLVVVPTVIGLTQSAAQTAITGAGLALGAVTEQHHASAPAGQVISQNPAAGAEVAAGSNVALVVSTGPEPVSVPNVAGMTRPNAESSITGAGLTVGEVSENFSDTAPKGQVISQTPGAGTLAAPGSAVSFVVSKGKKKTGIFGCSGGPLDEGEGPASGKTSDLLILFISVGMLTVAFRRRNPDLS